MNKAGYFKWSFSRSRVVCRVKGKEGFVDSQDHWQNAVLRLLDLDQTKAMKWVEKVLASGCKEGRVPWVLLPPEQRVRALIKGTAEFYGLTKGRKRFKGFRFSRYKILGESIDQVWVSRGGMDKTIGIVGNRSLGHGIAVHSRGREPLLLTPCDYEENYFENNIQGLGYGSYSSQESWRMEKARRQIRQIKGWVLSLGLAKSKVKLLDVGSGYG
jgi:hypothetical protein